MHGTLLSLMGCECALDCELNLGRCPRWFLYSAHLRAETEIITTLDRLTDPSDLPTQLL